MNAEKKPRRRKRDTPKPPPLTWVERRKNSDKAKAEAGEKRVTTWIPKEGSQALQRLKEDGSAGKTDRDILNAALVGLAQSLGLSGGEPSKDT